MKFNERFDIQIGLEEAQRRFVNRLHGKIFLPISRESLTTRSEMGSAIGIEIGEVYLFPTAIDRFVGTEFPQNLRAVEGWYATIQDPSNRKAIDSVLAGLISQSEVDLDIEWRAGKFYRKGAALLDQRLVNDVLHWLRVPKFESVLKPFEKGLQHLLNAHVKKESLQDVITDMYEAIEALAKIVTERPGKDLSGNRELFLTTVNASDAYKIILKNLTIPLT